ncbi:hypothetical protein KIPB_009768 [Kipferlia bialata]|uniref:Uncharacterized protein n=1 Tax=Kipferlia bialata TaxID=797122 RepID=A0A9K3D2W8_9EUKA|nr:hypothetical protein KIPB_009768 [Kipferlia bialata]|eukprot:g9768.t1
MMSIELIRKASAMMESLREYIPYREVDLIGTPWYSPTDPDLPGPLEPRHVYVCQSYNLADHRMGELFDSFARAAEESFVYAYVE